MAILRQGVRYKMASNSIRFSAFYALCHCLYDIFYHFVLKPCFRKFSTGLANKCLMSSCHFGTLLPTFDALLFVNVLHLHIALLALCYRLWQEFLKEFSLLREEHIKSQNWILTSRYARQWALEGTYLLPT